MSSLIITNIEHQEITYVIKEFDSYLKNAKCNYTVGESSFIIEFEDNNYTAINHIIDVCNAILEDIWSTSDLIKAIENSTNDTITFNYLSSIISIC